MSNSVMIRPNSGLQLASSRLRARPDFSYKATNQPAVGQLQPKVAQTVHRHCLVSIYVDMVTLWCDK